MAAANTAAARRGVPGPNRRCISIGWMPDSAVHTAMAESEKTAT